MRWLADPSRRRIANKSRRIGYSFAEGLRAVLGCLERKQTFIILSRGERQSKKFIEESVAPHVRAVGAFAQYTSAEFPKTDIYTQQVEFSNGSRILALPANPETARSYEGHVVLDEFAFHNDAGEIYKAVGPSITRGYSVAIISTPNGQQGAYYELAREAGLVDGRATTRRWSAHRTDIFEAVAQGCKDRDGNPLSIEDLRADCFDEEMWLQEYCCQFLSIASQWISPEIFERNASDQATTDLSLDPRGMYVGWDIARNRDLSVLWFLEQVGDITWTRGVMELRNVSTPDQVREVRALMPRIHRLAIDKTGMGLSMWESLDEEFRGKVEGVQFTLQAKEALAVGAKRRMEEAKCRIPDTEMIRTSFRSVKKTTTATGQARFDAEHDERYGHADHWWAFALAESAAAGAKFGLLGLTEFVKRENAREVEKVAASERNKVAVAENSLRCPRCNSPAITRIGNNWRCNSCSATLDLRNGKLEPAAAFKPNLGPGRREMMK